jgi:hypothetical protein
MAAMQEVWHWRTGAATGRQRLRWSRLSQSVQDEVASSLSVDARNLDELKTASVIPAANSSVYPDCILEALVALGILSIDLLPWRKDERLNIKRVFAQHLLNFNPAGLSGLVSHA